MSDQRGGGIAWTEQTWNPVRGCSRVSRGCERCYAESVARRFAGVGQPYEGLVRIGKDGRAKAQWNGVVRVVSEHLADPLRWTRPRMVFVNSMSDLFHEALPFETIAAIFGVMAACPKHTFQVLTKRPERAREFFAWAKARARDESPSDVCLYEARMAIPEGPGDPWEPRMVSLGLDHRDEEVEWPLPNVWLGVSVEDQRSADERIPHLLACPAAVRWVSYEPALGPVDFTHLDADRAGHPEWSQIDALTGLHTDMGRPCPDAPSRLDWIVVGGESGPGARPFDLAWARSVITQCRAAGTKAFVKQLGSHLVADCMRCRGDGIDPMRVDGADPVWCIECGGAAQSGIEPHRVRLDDRKGGDMAEWPPYLRVREWPKTTTEETNR